MFDLLFCSDSLQYFHHILHHKILLPASSESFRNDQLVSLVMATDQRLLVPCLGEFPGLACGFVQTMQWDANEI